MLVIANGAFKSGSTWLYFILKLLLDYPPPPRDWLNPDWKHPSIQPRRFPEFLETSLHRENNYLVKQHMPGHQLEPIAPLLDEHSFLFNIYRDFRDVVVSAFFHARLKDYRGNFDTWYWEKGREVHKSGLQYHRDFDRLIPAERRCTIDYAGLHEDFATELKKLCHTLRLEYSAGLAESVEAQSSFSAMKDFYDESMVIHGKKFFRRGVTGDYINYYTPAMLEDFRAIQAGEE